MDRASDLSINIRGTTRRKYGRSNKNNLKQTLSDSMSSGGQSSTMRNHVIVHCRADYLDDQTSGFWRDGTLWEAINIVGDHTRQCYCRGMAGRQ